MKKLHLYHIPIAYMLLYVVAILISGIWLFLLSQGLASADILQTLTHIATTPEPKSLHNFIEVATPHMFAIGTLIFVVAHFMLFSTNVSKKFSLRISLMLFTVALFNVLAYLFISFGLVVSGWIKLFSLALFVLVFLFMLGMVAFSL
ncbi:MAG: hypothetical protein DRG09_05190 [Epsilonproteobacteria bacterium]|nr:MAG: hypothetical protein DRG09_05190 [Campylobacterota bacterium]